MTCDEIAELLDASDLVAAEQLAAAAPPLTAEAEATLLALYSEQRFAAAPARAA